VGARRVGATHAQNSGEGDTGVAMERFYWLVPDVLAGCSRPGGTGPEPTTLDDDLDWLKLQGIGAVLSLTELPLAQGVLASCGLSGLHLAVPDLTPPTPPQLRQALAFIDWERAFGHGVVVHCLQGQGRTATVLGAYLIRQGLSATEAIAELRALCPGALSSASQERALEAFAARRDWVI
jgi:atypical dual specificity phosphatase